MSKLEISQQREYTVVKSNELIQRARYDLSLKEMKLFCFIVSKIKPNDRTGEWYSFTFMDFCKVFGLTASGENYKDIKQGLKNLRDKSFWLMNEDGSESLCGWLHDVTVDKRSKRIKVMLHEKVSRFLIGVTEGFLQYQLIYCLPMRSTYSLRLYEQLKAQAFKKRFEIGIDDLRKYLACPYDNFKDLRRRALDIAVREINLYTDLQVSWEPKKKGNTVISVKFKVKVRDALTQSVIQNNISAEINGQMSIYDLL